MRTIDRIAGQQSIWLLIILYAITHSILVNLSSVYAIALFLLFLLILVSVIYKINLSLIFFHIGTLLISLTTFRLGGEFFNGSDLFYLLSALLLFVNVLVSKGNLHKLFIRSNPLLIPFLIFLFGSVLSMMASDDIRTALISTGKYIFLFGIWLPCGIFLFDSVRKVRWMFIILAIASLLPITTCLSDYLLHTKMTAYLDQLLNLNIKTASENTRFGGVMGHPNNFSVLLVIVFPIAISVTLSSKTVFLRICGGIYFISVLTCAMITGSRAGILAFALELFLSYILIVKRKNFFSFMIFLLIIVSVVQATLTLFPQNPFARMKIMLKTDIGKYRPDVERVESMKQAMKYAWEYPITGIGVEHTATLTSKLFVHNTVVRFWASIGIFGLISCLWFYGKPLIICFKSIYKTFKNDFDKRSMMIIILCGFSGSLLFDMTAPQFHNRVKWILVIGLFALLNIENSSSGKINKDKSNDKIPISSLPVS
ncbi:O-antigen ligase family protein [Desulfobacterales bacterium HSG2]|nr:O-antigen ligase family protein [Desulfobacterales bacterium HSG2]